MGDKENRRSDPVDMEHHREITNTAGHFSQGDAGGEDSRRAEPGGESGPEQAALKEGDAAWHNRSNRSGELGENAVPGLGGKTASESQ